MTVIQGASFGVLCFVKTISVYSRCKRPFILGRIFLFFDATDKMLCIFHTGAVAPIEQSDWRNLPQGWRSGRPHRRWLRYPRKEQNAYRNSPSLHEAVLGKENCQLPAKAPIRQKKFHRWRESNPTLYVGEATGRKNSHGILLLPSRTIKSFNKSFFIRLLVLWGKRKFRTIART